MATRKDIVLTVALAVSAVCLTWAIGVYWAAKYTLATMPTRSEIKSKEYFLSLAVERGDVEMARTLLGRGAYSVGTEEAVRRGHLRMLELLLAYSDREPTCLLLTTAAAEGRIDIVDFLVNAGMDIDISPEVSGDSCRQHETMDPPNSNPLWAAVTKGNAGTVDTLLWLGADSGLRDSKGRTCLHIAAEFGRVDVVKILLEAGADALLQDRSGKTPLDYALQTGHDEVVAMLRNPGK
jgi:ankyrin repeat protein